MPRIDEPTLHVETTRACTTEVFQPILTDPDEPPPVRPKPGMTPVTGFAVYTSAWQTTSPTGLMDCIDDPGGHVLFSVCCIRNAVVLRLYTGIDSHVTEPSAAIACIASPSLHASVTRD